MRRTLVLAHVVALGLAACGHAQAPRAPAGVGRHVAIYMPGPDDAPATGGFTGVLRALERPADGDGDGVDGGDIVGELVDGDGGLGLSGAPPPPPWPGEAPAPASRSVAVVDDRRWLAVPADGRVTIDGVAATLALDSVVVEPLDGAALAVSWCDRPPAPAGAGAALRCQLRGVMGRHLVRIAYTASGASWQASHRVTAHLDAAGRGTAAIQSTFVIAAPGWPADAAEVELWRGLPDGPASPVQVWSGRTPLAATVSVPGTATPREVRARTIAIYRGAAIASARPPTDPAWNEESRADVQDWLLLDAPLPGGQAEVEVVGQAGSQIA
ncbi:MAG: hypothetical protein K8W52_43045, partial [Deltaproteobacteria bacterium]|nr:hypothetical protein [Deltaproteobacteria bacterium]